MKYRYFVAYSYHDEDGVLCHDNRLVERDEPILSYEDIGSIESDVNARTPLQWSGITILNFRLFDEAPAEAERPSPLVVRMREFIRSRLHLDHSPPCPCKTCDEARRLVAEADAHRG